VILQQAVGLRSGGAWFRRPFAGADHGDDKGNMRDRVTDEVGEAETLALLDDVGARGICRGLRWPSSRLRHKLFQ